MECPCCGKDCVVPSIDALAAIDDMYMACSLCAPDPSLDKSAHLIELPEYVERCSSCGKAPLDAVMLDALHVLEEKGLRDRGDSLKSVGSPLIAVGYPLAYPPRLGPKSLIIVGSDYSEDAAEAILDRVPEIKGVILGGGVPGVTGSTGGPHEWKLLAGCDLRGDVVQSLFGEIVIYKSQSKIHIEFPRHSAPKMKILERLYLRGLLTDVVDGLCGPGTLGLMCVLAGAKHVVLNDIWLPAVENVMLNLEANKSLLGIEKIERLAHPTSAIGSEPVLVGQATGACEIEVYHGDLTRLFSMVNPASVCLIDHFPGSDTSALQRACCGCKEVILI